MTDSPIIPRADVSPTCRGSTGTRHNGWNPAPLVTPHLSSLARPVFGSLQDPNPNAPRVEQNDGHSHGWCSERSARPTSLRTCGRSPCRSFRPPPPLSSGSARAGISSPTSPSLPTDASCDLPRLQLTTPTVSPKMAGLQTRGAGSPFFAAGPVSGNLPSPALSPVNWIRSTCPTLPSAPARWSRSNVRSSVRPGFLPRLSLPARPSPQPRPRVRWSSPAPSPLLRSRLVSTRPSTPSNLSLAVPPLPALFP